MSLLAPSRHCLSWGFIDGPDKKLYAVRVAVKGLFAPAPRPSSSVLLARRHLGTVRLCKPTMVASALHISDKSLKAKARVTWGRVHFIADTLAEPPSPVRALIWPPTRRCRDAQLVPVESILPPVVVELHLEDPDLAEALPV